MAEFQPAGAYRTSMTRAGALLLAAENGQPPAARLIVSGYSGDPVPREVRDPRLERVGGSGRWRLVCLEGCFEFTARGVEVQQALPGFFDEMLAAHALRSRDKVVVRWLLWLLRLPGGAKLLRSWHARRGR